MLILVSTDPRVSGRTVEAVRVAAGLSVHERLSVTLCLRGEAVRFFSCDPDDQVGGAVVAEFFEILGESCAQIFAVGIEPVLVPSGVKVLTEAELERKMATVDRVVAF